MNNKLLQISVNEYCNFNCVFCNQHESLAENFSELLNKKSISIESVISILKQNSQIKFETLSMVSTGEFFLHKEWKKIFEIILEYNYKNEIAQIATLNTNGSLLKKEDIDYIFELFTKYPQNFKFVFSINASDKEVFKKISGSDEYEKVVDNTLYFLEKSKNFNDKNGNKLFCGVQFVIVKENADQVKNFLELWENNMLKSELDFEKNLYNRKLSKNYFIILRRAFLVNQKSSDLLFIKTVRDNGFQLTPEENETLLNTFDANTEEYDFDILKRKPCSALWEYPYISADENITICCRDINFDYKYGILSENKTVREAMEESDLLKKYRISHITGDFRNMPICYRCPGYEINLSEEELEENIKNISENLLVEYLHRKKTGFGYDFYNITIDSVDSIENTLEFLDYINKRSDQVVCENIDITEYKNYFSEKTDNMEYKHTVHNPDYPCVYWFRNLKTDGENFNTGCDKVDIPYDFINILKKDIVDSDISNIPFQCRICQKKPEIKDNDLYYILGCYSKEYSLLRGEEKVKRFNDLLKNNDLNKMIEFCGVENNRKLYERFWEYIKSSNICLDKGTIFNMFDCFSYTQNNLYSMIKYFPKEHIDVKYGEILNKAITKNRHPVLIEYFCDYCILNKEPEKIIELFTLLDFENYYKCEFFKGKKILSTVLKILVDKKEFLIVREFLDRYSEYLSEDPKVFDKLYSYLKEDSINPDLFFEIILEYFKDSERRCFEYISVDLKDFSNNVKEYILKFLFERILDSGFIKEYSKSFIDFDLKIFRKYINEIRKKDVDEYINLLKYLVFEGFFEKGEKQELLKELFKEIFEIKDNYLIEKAFEIGIFKNMDFPENYSFNEFYHLFKTENIDFDVFLWITKKVFINSIERCVLFLSGDFLFLSLDNQIKILSCYDELKKYDKDFFNRILTIFIEKKQSDRLIEILNKIEIDIDVKLYSKIYSEFINDKGFLSLYICLSRLYFNKNKDEKELAVFINTCVDNLLFKELYSILEKDVISDISSYFDRFYNELLNSRINPELFSDFIENYMKKSYGTFLDYLSADFEKLDFNTKNILYNRFYKKIKESDAFSGYHKIFLNFAPEDIVDNIKTLYKQDNIRECLDILSFVNKDIFIEKYGKSVLDFFESLQKKAVEKDIFPELTLFLDNFNLSELFFKYGEFKEKVIEEKIKGKEIVFFLDKYFPDQKKDFIEMYFGIYKNLSFIYRINLLKCLGNDIRLSGHYKDFIELFNLEKMHYSFYRLISSNIYTKDYRFFSDIKGLKRIIQALYKKGNHSVLRELSGIYQDQKNIDKALYCIEEYIKNNKVDLIDYKTFLFLMEKKRRYFRVLLENRKTLILDPLFFIKKSVYILLKIVRIK